MKPGLKAPLTACLLAAAMTGCASAPAPDTSFDGEWGVEWCHRTDPTKECGGFHVRLVEDGGRLCGSYTGALVGLRQLDEGGPGSILGTRTGDTAMLTIRSERNGDLFKVRAKVSGQTLAWDEFKTLERGGSDVSITGGKTVLEKKPPSQILEATRQGCAPELRPN